jgi:DNA repair photolyase
MKKKTSDLGEQLLLFSSIPTQEGKVSQTASQNPETSINQPDEIVGEPSRKNAVKPSHVGSTRVEYVETKTILKAPGGFIGAYKFTLNPYSGCSFGCDYCYARFFAQTMDEQKSWGEWVKVKENAVELLRKARVSKSIDRRLETGDTVYMSTVTDPYQPIEYKVGLTRRVLEELLEVQPRLTIQTRSPLVTRDIDLFQRFERVRVNFTITTDSEEIRKHYEPHCPSIDARLKAAKQLANAGVPIGISISPMLPILDPERFAHQIAELNAAEYVTQFFKPTRSRFSAGSSEIAVKKMLEDDWTGEKYAQVREVISRVLGSDRQLLEGNEGYAPA